jgi:cytochrome c oxidase subunit 3|tara:strand:- start:544 stop:1119 length:576 start_codon:yes stop_codon:yes gene_type:complete
MDTQNPINSEPGILNLSHAQVFVYMLLAVVTILFLFLTNAYVFRMNFEDWQPLPVPSLLWVNTCSLVIASIGMGWATRGVKINNQTNLKIGLLIGGLFALFFLTGQFWAWQQLIAYDYLVANNPANTFFYLITALHGLHITGGIVGWIVITKKSWKTDHVESHSAQVSLLATYWHYLLLIWVMMFGLFLST